jgi:hypothetical protein
MVGWCTLLGCGTGQDKETTHEDVYRMICYINYNLKCISTVTVTSRCVSWSRDSTVSIVIMLQDGQVKKYLSIPGRDKRFFFPPKVQTGPEAHPASCS